MAALKVAVIKAALPFLAIPVIIGAYVAGRAGVSGLLVGAVLLSMAVPDLVRGSTLEKSDAYRSSSGNWLFARSRTLSGLPARLSASRYVLVGLLLAVGGAVETLHSGRIQAWFEAGSGWGWMLVVLGVLFAATAVVRATPGLPPGRDTTRWPRLGRAIALILSGGLLLFAIVLILLGWCELVAPGSIADAIRKLNPLGG